MHPESPAEAFGTRSVGGSSRSRCDALRRADAHRRGAGSARDMRQWRPYDGLYRSAVDATKRVSLAAQESVRRRRRALWRVQQRGRLAHVGADARDQVADGGELELRAREAEH